MGTPNGLNGAENNQTTRQLNEESSRGRREKMRGMGARRDEEDSRG